MSATSLGRIGWSLKRDRAGHRDYNLKCLVESDYDDGPAVVYAASGLPAIGAPWVFGNDNDPDAYCSPEATVTPVNVNNERGKYWTVDIPFTTRPLNRCMTASVGSPILEPPDISGSFVKYTKMATKNRFGSLIKSSSHEPIPIEKDANRPSVVIKQNVASLALPTFTAMIDTLNDATLWGLAARKIKLSNANWQRKYYGVCTYYYVRTFEFDVRFEGFDISDAVDKGFCEFDKELYTDTPAARANPTKYKTITDGRGNPTPVALPLDGNGSRLTNPLAPVYLPTIQLYEQSNFLTLGIPTSL